MTATFVPSDLFYYFNEPDLQAFLPTIFQIPCPFSIGFVVPKIHPSRRRCVTFRNEPQEEN
jgi:hypothetical protein